MSYRLQTIIFNSIWIVFVATITWLFSLQISTPKIPRVDPPHNGVILFWQNGAIYTISDNGTRLQKVTPAAYGDPKRQIAVSPGCFGQIQAGCYVLVKHVLYDALGHGMPLPLSENYQWIRAPAVWSPDGRTLAYMVSRHDDGRRAILALNMDDLVVQKIADGVDESVVPAWSAGCADVTADNCFFAYGIRTPSGESGNRVVVKQLHSGQKTVLKTVAGRGTDLRWSADDNLYYGGGELGWFNARTDAPLISQTEAVSVIQPSPDMMLVAYNTILSAQKPAELRLAAANSGFVGKPLYIFRQHMEDEQSAPQQILWSTDGKSFLAFDQGTLIHYNTQQKSLAVLYKTDALDNFSSYAISPAKDAVVLVERTVALAEPQYRMISVTNSGDVTVLVPRTGEPIVVFAWLPADYLRYLLPTYHNVLL